MTSDRALKIFTRVASGGLDPATRDRLLEQCCAPAETDWGAVLDLLESLADTVVRLDAATLNVDEMGDPDSVTNMVFDARGWLCDLAHHLQHVLDPREVQLIIRRFESCPPAPHPQARNAILPASQPDRVLHLPSTSYRALRPPPGRITTW